MSPVTITDVIAAGAWLGSAEQREALRQFARDYDWSGSSIPVIARPARHSTLVDGIDDSELAAIHADMIGRVAEEMAFDAVENIGLSLMVARRSAPAGLAREAIARLAVSLALSAREHCLRQEARARHALGEACKASGYGPDDALEIETIAEAPPMFTEEATPGERSWDSGVIALLVARGGDRTFVYVESHGVAVPVTDDRTRASIAIADAAWVFPGVDVRRLLSGGAS